MSEKRTERGAAARRIGWILGLAVLAAAPLLALPALAQDDDLKVGQLEFEMSCASCHGLDGKGQGPVGPYLTPVPSDLTRLTVRFNGTFPADYVRQHIDGQKDVGAHGTRMMPVWGARYLEEFGQFTLGDQNDKALVAERVERLVRYVESLQTP